MNRGRSLLIAPLGLVLLAGTACGPTQLGAAAIVGEDRITVAEVQDAVQKTRALQEQQAVLVRGEELAAGTVVERRVQELIFARAAAELGVRATDTEVAALIDAQRRGLGPARFLQALAVNGLNLEQVDAVFRTEVLSRKIADKLAAGAQLSDAELDRRVQQKLIAVGARLGIKINPRYGRYNPDTADIAQTIPDFIRAVPE